METITENAIEIERRPSAHLPYSEFLREFVRKNRPVVIQNSVPHWRALDEWTPDFFRTQFGKELVGVTYGIKMPMAELIDRIAESTPNNPGPYLHQLIIHHHLPELLPWVSPENIYGFPRRFSSPVMPKRCRRPDGYLKLLIGGPGGKFPFMHYDNDNANAMITEIYGDKEFFLYSPEDTKYVYPKPDTINISQIEDIGNPDFEKFPLFRNARPLRVVLKPGETIYIPSRWWHTARVVTPSISVCTNMLDSSNWHGFVDWLCRPIPRHGAAVRVAARAYLTALGTLLNVAEYLQCKFPKGALSRRLSALAPLHPEETRTSA
jgi:hypothetical protein